MAENNIIFSFLVFIMALGVVVAFIPVIGAFTDMAQQSDSMNCRGYIHNGNENNTLSFNSSLDGGNSGNALGCLAIKLYLPYILLTFLIGGIGLVLLGKFKDALGFGGSDD